MIARDEENELWHRVGGAETNIENVVAQIRELSVDLKETNKRLIEVSQALTVLTTGHRVVLWILSGLGVIATALGALYSGAFNARPH